MTRALNWIIEKVALLIPLSIVVATLLLLLVFPIVGFIQLLLDLVGIHIDLAGSLLRFVVFIYTAVGTIIAYGFGILWVGAIWLLIVIFLFRVVTKKR